jgi:hypothetical protein
MLCTARMQAWGQLLEDTLHRYCTENWKKLFPEKQLRGLSPNFYTLISVSDLYIPTIGLSILLQQIRRTDPGNI